jgi:hypothetical protein
LNARSTGASTTTELLGTRSKWFVPLLSVILGIGAGSILRDHSGRTTTLMRGQGRRDLQFGVGGCGNPRA